MNDDRGARARQWLIEGRCGALSTSSADESTEGWPFGSIVPYALTAEGRPIVLLASIAQHTRNLKRDGRASLLVAEGRTEGDPQAGWRVTVMGRFAQAAAAGRDELHARYREIVPDAPAYITTHDFSMWVLDPVRVRVIGGFGDIGWLEPEHILRDPDGGGIGQAAAAIIGHMNADHADALVAIVGAFGPGPCAGAEMIAVDRTGFLVRTRGPDGLVHIGFGREIEAAGAREALVDLTRRARARLESG